MAPNLTGPGAAALFLAGAEVIDEAKPRPQEAKLKPQPVTKPSSSDTVNQYEWQIVWRNVFAFVYLNVGSLYGLYLLCAEASLYTTLWAVLVAWLGGMGVTAGAHRLWAHRSYRARWPLRLLLMLCQTLAFQNHLHEWVRDHRVHHKFTDTDADPHNSRRGFFFSHMGWLCLRKHPDVIRKGKTVDMTDLERDWVVMFQKKYYAVLMPLLCFVFPMYVPIKFWGESFWTSFYVASILRYNLSLHGTWLVNSAAHIWGMKPYDRFISASENLTVALFAFGEGWHNYHHAFPWDYKTSEFHSYRVNLTCAFIDFFARLGWAYELKTVPQELVLRRATRTGDGSRRLASDTTSGHHHHHHQSGTEVWGWGDKDMSEEEVKIVQGYLKDVKDKNA